MTQTFYPQYKFQVCIYSIKDSASFYSHAQNIPNALVNIQPVNSIRIDCDLKTGSFYNELSSHTIYEFSLSVESSYKTNLTVTKLTNIFFQAVSTICK